MLQDAQARLLFTQFLGGHHGGQLRRFTDGHDVNIRYRGFVTGANLGVPLVAIFLRKGYGLGAMAMTGGGFVAPVYAAAWPTGEFGGMGLEGAVQLGFRKELDAVADKDERKALFEKLVQQSYERGKATEAATQLEIDAVIDPADTRAVILRALASTPPVEPPAGRRRNFVDTW